MQGDVATIDPHAPSAAAATAASATPVPQSPISTMGFNNGTGHNHRPSTATMRHNRTSSRLADGASRNSDDDAAKTAVKVAVRIRPPLRPTDPGFDLIPQRFRESTCDVPTSNSLSVQSPQGKKLFVFDRVFDERTNQEGVWEYVSDSVSSFVKGYNVSILAYGQSGAGKSYTMGTSGSEDQDDPNIKGIIPRAAKAVFEKLNGITAKPTGLQAPKRYSTQGLPTMSAFGRTGMSATKNWELKATYVEIYNEQLRDLLLPESTPLHERSQVVIREDTKGRIMLTGLTQVPIHSPEDLLNALNFGSAIRQTDATAINARSSRSHAVFSLNLIQRKADAAESVPPMPPPPPLPTSSKLEKRRSMPVENSGPGADNVVTIDSKLHFVDLAGSERLKNTGATGERAKEGISINAGLASLGKVISQLSSKNGSGHISYRDSRLTRLLQDSLGGNAITFMVACVTPASFHLSETLNTVHYAQRARAIQSKPEIQQSHEEGDKQAAIDRLRAEVTFLRDQIRHSDAGRDVEKPERVDRARGTERELQSQLMDMQENYNALSHRHARLIAEISKSRDSDNIDTPLLREAIGENASERIKRSNSFAEAVEQVVLEYEKTIQSLETSLSKTRANLSSTESTLLEKETRIAYMETIQQQLQARVSKYMEREASGDSYTKSLEAKMEGSTGEDERKESLIVELRKELSRIRESESGAEDYISTLEERLAEAEQDQEIMQREIDRLEHVVERQRSIGRLDNLLGELDGIRGGEAPAQSNGTASPHSPRRVNGHAAAPAAADDDDEYDPFRAPSTSSVDDFERVEREEEDLAPADHSETRLATTDDAAVASPSQNDFMAEKLENLTEEFFDLRSEHESVLNDFDNLKQKYRTALETLAKLEYEKIPKAPATPEESARGSFLAEAGTKDVEEEQKAPDTEGQHSSSLLSSEELSSQEQQSTGEDVAREGKTSDSKRTTVSMEESATDATGMRSPEPVDHEEILQEMETLKKLHAEKEVSVAELTKNYMSLAQRHEATLSHVEELKQEVIRSQNNRPASPSLSASPGFSKGSWRRKSDDLLSNSSDRASRSFVSMKALVLNNFEDQGDLRRDFEQHLSTVMSELHGRSERVTALEAELGTIRKEMENKQTIITGLTRERSSLAAASASVVDFSVIGQLRDQLVESENQIRSLHEQHALKEKELREQVHSLQATLAEQQKVVGHHADQLPTPGDDTQMPGEFPSTPSPEAPQTPQGNPSRSLQAREITRLQKEVTDWENKHRDAMDSMTASQTELLNTISELQESLRVAERGADSSSMTATPVPSDQPRMIDADVLELEREKHREIIESLTLQINEHKHIADERVSRLEQLQQDYARILEQLDGDDGSRESAQTELQSHRDLVMNLENQLQVHKSAIMIHQESLESLQASHTKEIEELNGSMGQLEKEASARYAALSERHERETSGLSDELVAARGEISDLLQNASSALGYDTHAGQLRAHISGLVEEGKDLHARHLKSTNELKAVQEELQNAINRSVEMESEINDLKATGEAKESELHKMTEKYNKSAALVDQLEEQLNSNFDSHQETNKRLSSMHSETAQQRFELERELEDQKFRTVQLQQQLEQFKHMSVTSNGSSHLNRDSLSPETAAATLGRSSSASSTQRKSMPTALPTPPPSIPLPPLPASPIAGGFSDNHRTTSPTPRGTSPVPTNSPPGSRHGSHEGAANPAMAQLLEEQEARIRTIEKHLFAEKQLTATLEEALVDLETSANRTKAEMENWRKKCQALEDEIVGLQKERSSSRASLQAVEEEREMRVRAERARQALEQRMAELNAGSKNKKKKNALNCF